MTVDLKPLEDQVVVVTGASSGIGLTTARMAAERGARLVLAARSEDALAELAEEIRADGGDAVAVVADVSDREDVRDVVRTAEETYGGFDTWVNVAGVFIYGRLRDVPVEDMREQFETNVWGLLYGSLEAADHLAGRGGAIVNVGSVASDRAVPLQGSYSASKHAVEAFTDALRMELEHDDVPVSVTLVEPSPTDTPYARHAKNYMDSEPRLPPPLYAPETVARAVLHAAEHPQRDAFVGAGGRGIAALGRLAPGLTDALMERLFYPLQRTGEEPGPRAENSLDGPAGDLEERGDYEGYVPERSLYTEAFQRGSASGKTAAGLAAAATVAYAAYRAACGNGGGE